MKLTFLISSPTIRSTSKKSIKSIVGGLERVDVISRCLHNISKWKERFDFPLSLILYLSHPDERSIFSIEINDLSFPINSELSATLALVEIFKNPTHYQVKTHKIDFNDLIKNIAESNKIFLLTQEGIPINDIAHNFNFQSSMCFVLGSQYDLTQKQAENLIESGANTVSLGSKEYLASHVITIVCQHLFQRRSKQTLNP